MSIDGGTVTQTINRVDRCWRFEAFIDDDLSQQLRFHRELRGKDTVSGVIVSRDQKSLTTTARITAQIATTSYTAGGITATGQQILQLINKMADVERQIDINAGIT